MLRLVFPVLVLAFPAFAQDADELCTVSSEIAGAAVVERNAGEPQDTAISAITADLDGVSANYAAAVQPIVEWVYTLPQEQLTDEVAVAYKTACLAQ